MSFGSISTLCLTVFHLKAGCRNAYSLIFVLVWSHVCLALILFPDVLCYAKINEAVFSFYMHLLQKLLSITSCKQ